MSKREREFLEVRCPSKCVVVGGLPEEREIAAFFSREIIPEQEGVKLLLVVRRVPSPEHLHYQYTYCLGLPVVSPKLFPSPYFYPHSFTVNVSKVRHAEPDRGSSPSTASGRTQSLPRSASRPDAKHRIVGGFQLAQFPGPGVLPLGTRLGMTSAMRTSWFILLLDG